MARLYRQSDRRQCFRLPEDMSDWVPGRARAIEAMHPVPQGLALHAADPGSFRPPMAVQHGRQGQQPPALIGVLRTARQIPHVFRAVIPAKLYIPEPSKPSRVTISKRPY